jgi:hypothetical protein
MSTEVKEFAIVKSIMKLLKLDDAGKISKFFNQEVKSAKEAIEGIELNIQAKELYRKQALSKSEKEIEDATAELEDAYQNVLPENVDTNAKMTAYSAQYWAGVKKAEEKLARLNKEAEEAAKRHEEYIKGEKEQIAKYQARIARICK